MEHEDRQVIIALGREYGSGGHEIAKMIAERMNLPFYDRNLLSEVAREKGIDVSAIAKYDESPRHAFVSQTVRGYSNAPEDGLANMEFDYIRSMAARGDSFVIVGRCADAILAGNKGLITIFVTADDDRKIERISRIVNVSEAEAARMIRAKNKKRKSYHNYYSDGKWGDSRYYDLLINSSRLGLEKTADVIEAYIKARTGQS